MLYTVGKPSIYDPLMARDEDAAKGITGSVWLTFDDIKSYRDQRAPYFKIYGVVACWEEDTKDIGQEFRSLTKPGKLIRVDQDTGEELERKDDVDCT